MLNPKLKLDSQIVLPANTQLITPYMNFGIFLNRKLDKVCESSIREHMNIYGFPSAVVEMKVEEDGYKFDEISVMMSPTVVDWYCDRYKFPKLDKDLYPKLVYFSSHTPGFFKSMFSRVGIDIAYDGCPYPVIEALVGAFKSFKRNKQRALKFCAKMMESGGIILGLASFNKIPLFGTISVYVNPKPPKGKLAPSYSSMVEMHKKMGIDVDISLISDFEEHGLECKHMSYRVSRGKVQHYAAVEFFHPGTESFKKAMSYLKSKGLTNDSHYSLEGESALCHVKVAFSNKKPKTKAYFWVGSLMSNVKPQVTVR